MPKRVAKIKERLPVRTGKQLYVFRHQLTELDREVRVLKRVGTKIFLTKADLRWAFNEAKGSCQYCGITLFVKGGDEIKPYFIFYHPLKIGGKVAKENLIVVCFHCKDQHAAVKRDRPRERIYDFNTIPDLIQRLVEEVNELNKCDDEYIRLYQENVKRLKRELNFAIIEMVHTLAYNPRSDAVDIELEKRIEEQNTLADIITKMAKQKEENELAPLRGQLVQILKEINKTRKYAILKF